MERSERNWCVKWVQNGTHTHDTSVQKRHTLLFIVMQFFFGSIFSSLSHSQSHSIFRRRCCSDSNSTVALLSSAHKIWMHVRDLLREHNTFLNDVMVSRAASCVCVCVCFFLSRARETTTTAKKWDCFNFSHFLMRAK